MGNKKAELQKRLDSIMVKSNNINESDFYYFIARDAINAIPDEEENKEKPFIPNCEGLWFRKASEGFDWHPVLVVHNGVNGDYVVETRNGYETLKEYGGLWHPKRILMPGEE